LGSRGDRGYCHAMQGIGAVLIDIDGLLTVSWKPLDGAVGALKRLRAAALPLALVTNTTSRTRASIATTLAAAGFPVTVEDILTAPVIAGAYLADHYPGARCLLRGSGDIRADLAGVTLVGADDPAPVDVVIVGGAGSEFSYQALNRAFGHLQRGAALVAMHRGMYWRTDEGLQLDSGAFVAGLEQAAGTAAEVVGKPAAAFFAAALAHLGADAAHTLMVGGDIENDVLAAQRQGLTGALKTGKYLPGAHRSATGTPDHILDSFAGLPALLEQLPWERHPGMRRVPDGRSASRQHLRLRLQTHYSGNAEGSTLRKTLGCLLADELGIQLRRVGSGNGMTFVTGEQRLSAWMAQNAFVSWAVRDRPQELEDNLIATLDLPLNLRGEQT